MTTTNSRYHHRQRRNMTTSASTSTGPGYRNLQEKAEEINMLLLQPNVDLWRLRALALSDGGLVNDTLRKRAWPKLVGLQKYHSEARQKYTTTAGTTFSTTTTSNTNISTRTTRRTTSLSTTLFEDQEHAHFEIDTALLPSASNVNMNFPDLSTTSTTATDATISTTAAAAAAAAAAPISGSFTTATHHTSLRGAPDLMVESLDAEQIERDVARCTWHLLTGSQRSRRKQMKHKDKSRKVMSLLKRKQRRLANLINLTLVESYHRQRQASLNRPILTTSTSTHLLPCSVQVHDVPEHYLRYYQGYHDVACIFLHALGGGQSSSAYSSSSSSSHSKLLSQKHQQGEDPLGLDLPATVLCQLSASHFRDNMRQNFMSLQTALKVTLYPLLYTFDVQIHNHLKDCDMEPFFCLSWVLTWFSHDIRDTNLCKRLFDALLCGHPLFVLYIALAMMLHPINRQKILETDCDFASLHQCLSSLPKNSCKVGWKSIGDGAVYVSDDDDEDDGRSTQTDDWTTLTGLDSNLSYQKHAESVAGSVATAPSSSSQTVYTQETLGTTNIEEGKTPKVPFQDLIDRALEYMKAYPPRSLLKLARKYYSAEEWVMMGGGVTPEEDPQSELATNIQLLQEAPAWSLASTAPADWILKQRLRQDLGLKSTSRKDRRRRRRLTLQQQQQRKSQSTIDQELDAAVITPVVDHYFLRANANERAVIAAGFGPGPEAALARRRRRKRIRTAIAVGFLAMTIGLMYQTYVATPTRSESIDSESSSTKKPLLIHKLLDRKNDKATEFKTMGSTTTSSASKSMSEQIADFCNLPGWFSDSEGGPLDAAIEKEGPTGNGSSGIKTTQANQTSSTITPSTHSSTKPVTLKTAAKTTLPVHTATLSSSTTTRQTSRPYAFGNSNFQPLINSSSRSAIAQWLRKARSWILKPFRFVLRKMLHRSESNPITQQDETVA